MSYDDGKAEEVKPVEKPAAPKPEKKVEPASAPKAVPMYAPEVLQKKESRANDKPRLMMLAQWLCNQVEWRITVKAGDGLSDTITLKTARNPSPIVWPDPPTDKKQCPHCGCIDDDRSNCNCTCPDCRHYQPETDNPRTDLSGD